ncbi:MAG: thiopurine S-methyltransferase [Halofilum sp. (in: g-proteobacteria)]|nr:thiopurine S-methyltransferase [Halofilum sp. (in: g-proteobacteria)]
MEADFWHARWRDGNIGFHRGEVNPWLRTGLPRLRLSRGARVLVPLCGKSLDLGWLVEQGLRPVGVELSPIACAAVFEERGVTPVRTAAGPLEHLAGDGIELYCGDFLDSSLADAGPFDALWDRAALIALPAGMRADYVRQCARLLAPGAGGLLVSIEYDPSEMDGPPFSVTPSDVRALYGDSFDLAPIVEGQYCEPSGHLRERGLTAMHESVWLLNKRALGEAK